MRKSKHLLGSCILFVSIEDSSFFFFFFFNDTATTEIYTLSLHDALPICLSAAATAGPMLRLGTKWLSMTSKWIQSARSEEHTSELQSQSNLVCRLLLEKKKKMTALPNGFDLVSSTSLLLAPHRHMHHTIP